MEKIIAELAEMLARAERVQANAERRYLEARGADELESLENDLNWYACGYADAMRYALQAVKAYHSIRARETSRLTEVQELLKIIREAHKSAGWRELYAIEHGNPSQEGNLITWTYDKGDDYQDANGATYDIERRRWVG